MTHLKFFKANINCWRKNINRVNDLDLQDRMFKAGVKMAYLKNRHVLLNPDLMSKK